MIYTSITNNYDTERDDILVYTETESPIFERRARMYKILSHKFADDSFSVWVDANIYINIDENRLIDEWLGDADMALYKHPLRNCIYDEYTEILRLGRVKNNIELEILKQQIEYYKNTLKIPKQINTLAETGIIIRRNNEIVRRFNEAWWAEVCRWSYRDQVSFPVIYEEFKNEMKVNFIGGDMRRNKYITIKNHKNITQPKQNMTKNTKISIITPTNNPIYLKELEDSLYSQKYQNWEWVILLNNGAKYESTDERIKIYESTKKTSFVGALKKEACSYCTGDVILEIDHDDFITSNCLDEVNLAFSDDEIGFVYSKTIQLDDGFKPYNPNLGWTYTKVMYKDKELYSMNNLPLYPGNVGYIWYTPNHLRAWRKSVYDEIGGHDETLEICDDQDLICRLYLKTKFKEIPKPLYFYRVTGNNTWLLKNEQIQKTTFDIYDKYINELTLRYCELTNTESINIYNRTHKENKFKNMSVDEFINSDIKPKSVGLIRLNDTLHFFENKNIVFSKFYDILIDGGMLMIAVPDANTQAGFMDPNTKTYWVKNGFWYYMNDKEQRIQFQPEEYKHIAFKDKRLYNFFPTTWHKKNNIGYIVVHLEK